MILLVKAVFPSNKIDNPFDSGRIVQLSAIKVVFNIAYTTYT